MDVPSSRWDEPSVPPSILMKTVGPAPVPRAQQSKRA
jgi:hypothetical protein